MKQSQAITKYVRIAPRKARKAADLIRGKSVMEAINQLTFCNLKAGRLLKRTLMSAVANAETQQSIQREQLTVSEVRVDEGPTMKRAKSRCRGGRFPIMKRMSHLTVGVSAKEQG